jgi:hypothetical protein
MENPYESEGYQAPTYEDINLYTRGFLESKPKESKKKPLMTSKKKSVAKAA